MSSTQTHFSGMHGANSAGPETKLPGSLIQNFIFRRTARLPGGHFAGFGANKPIHAAG
jgi:hypothetical protein